MTHQRGEDILRRVAELPVSRWSYKDDPQGARHIGPMAQDFAAAFQVGSDDRHISDLDAVGVALAAAGQLARDYDTQLAHLVAAERAVAERDARIAELTAKLRAQEERVGKLEALLTEAP